MRQVPQLALRHENDADVDGSGDLLFVGRLSPHKGQARLIQALYYLNRIETRPRRLVLVGRGDPVYTDYLRLLARGLGLEHLVELTGRVGATELDARYRSAAAFVSLSEHEGFGIPLVEAMRHGLPVFGYGVPGVRETLGDAGCLLHTRKPHRIAEILAAGLSDGKFLAGLRATQAARLAELRNEQSRERAQRLLVATLERALRGAARPRPRRERRESPEATA